MSMSRTPRLRRRTLTEVVTLEGEPSVGGERRITEFGTGTSLWETRLPKAFVL
jgi:hypothetical protein